MGGARKGLGRKGGGVKGRMRKKVGQNKRARRGKRVRKMQSQAMKEGGGHYRPLYVIYITIGV